MIDRFLSVHLENIGILEVTPVLVASMLVVYAQARLTPVEPPIASVERTPCG